MELAPGQLAEMYRAFSSICAVLGGFSIAFLVIMVTVAPDRKVASWATGSSVVAVACFLPAALNTFLASITATSATSAQGLEAAVNNATGTSAFLLVLGVLALLVSLGLTGWIRSRRIGILSTVMAVLAALACWQGLSLML